MSAPKTKHVKCTARYPVDLAHGQVLGPGDTADVDVSDPHHRALIDTGALTEVTQPKEK